MLTIFQAVLLAVVVSAVPVLIIRACGARFDLWN
tara:strand:+ start:2077 stop:2178 length:102 start_codon:yes stop_codon:yes gene_type:complete